MALFRRSNKYYEYCKVQTISKKLSNTLQVKTRKEKLVLLGTGWGSYSVLQHIDKQLYDVTVVSPRNHFLFTPLLNSTTVGTLEFRSIIESIHQRKHKDTDFHLAEAVSLDPINKILSCSTELDKMEYNISYDKLVIGVGSTSNTFGIPGVEQNAFFLKEIKDARAIRSRIISNLETSMLPRLSEVKRNKLLHFVIVGGGPTGIEFGAELYDFITEDVSKLFPHIKDKVHVTLVEGQSILPSFDKKLRKFAEKKFHQRKNYHLIKDFVTEVQSDKVILKSGNQIQTNAVVWSTGIAPRSFTVNLDCEKSASGQLIVDEYMRLQNCENVYAIGDCACVESRPLPATGQVAERQGRYLAKSFNKISVNDGVGKPFTWNNFGMLAYIGGHDAVADLPTPGGKLSGFFTWLLWRSVYLTRLGSWKNRFQVPFDWTRQLMFGRDTSRF